MPIKLWCTENNNTGSTQLMLDRFWTDRRSIFGPRGKSRPKKRPNISVKSLICMVGRPRLERGTNGLKVHCSTN